MNASGGTRQRFPPHTPPSLRWAGVQTTKPVDNHRKERNTIRQDGVSFWNAAGRVELAASTGAHQRTDCCWISRRAACPQAAVYRRCLRLLRGGVRAPRPTHERVKPFPARRCRAGNGFPRRCAPRSKCPLGTPRNDRGVGLSTRCHHPTGWCFFSYSARRNSGFRSRRPSSAAAICPSRASRSPLRVPFSVR